ncbi:MAG TPA: amidohydrolase family protein [Azospirillaceae bacterium]|nr:amidohydrolase family protein [Azospirillaceae bacterium]
MIPVRTAAAAALLLALPAAASAKTVYVTADRLLDVVAGGYVEKPAILVRDGRVAEVGTQGQLAVPADAERLDLSGLTLLPGFIDMHVHLTSRHDLMGYEGLKVSIPDQTIDGVANAHKTLMAGFTAARNVGAEGFADVGLRDGINEGKVAGPRLYVSGPPLGATGGHCDNNLLPPEYAATSPTVGDGPWELVHRVRYVNKYGADLVKICATGGVFSKGTTVGAQQLTEEELAAIVAEAHRLGMRVAAHAHGTSGIKAAIRAGVDTVEHASFLDDEAIRLAKERGTVLSMDIYNTEHTLTEGAKHGVLPESLEKERQVGTVQRESFAKAVKAGVKMVYATDAGVYPHGDNGRQFTRMVRFGMTPLQAVRAATVNAADALGASADIGAVAPGRFADMVGVPSDPLADVAVLENVPVVVKGGEVVKDARRR